MDANRYDRGGMVRNRKSKSIAAREAAVKRELVSALPRYYSSPYTSV